MANQAEIGGVKIGSGAPVRLMGVINLSPESFFKGSVLTKSRALADKTKTMTQAGADFIDVGAMSTAPYLKTNISEEEEAKRLAWALPIIRKNTSCPISVDTSRAKPAEAALKYGAKILNDITGLASQPGIQALAHDFDGLILMAHSLRASERPKDPVGETARIFKKILHDAHRLKIPAKKIVLDPGIGFFRFSQIPWWQWDLKVIKGLKQLGRLGPPLLIGLSRKSFIGHLLGGKPAEDRLAGSLAATLVAVQNGAAIIRTHDVEETKRAIAIWNEFRKV